MIQVYGTLQAKSLSQISMKKKHEKKHSILNRRATFDYSIEEVLIVGIELSGAEVKSLRMGHGDLNGSYITVKDNELFLINASIHGTNGIIINEQDKTRTRKILAKRKEINHLIEKKTQGRTIIPLEIYTNGRFIKVKIGLGKGKKNYDKRQVIKKRDIERSISNL